MSNPQAATNDELEIAEAQNSLVDLLYDYASQAVTTRVGQFVYRRVDGLLSTIEKTARWSLPQPPPCEEDTSKMNISPPPLIRPLPWLLFLPALIILRMVRHHLSFLALILGKPPICPETIVAFLQNKRRKLRALKYRGQKLDRINRAEKLSENELETTWLSRITLPLRTVICTRRVGNRPVKTVLYHHPTHLKHHKHEAKKRNVDERDDGDSEESFEDVGCQELLERYANHAGDSSYVAEEEPSEDSSDSFISDLDKSIIEEEAQKDDNSATARKESNGHTNLEKHKKSEEPKQKSALNVESGRPVSHAATIPEEVAPSTEEAPRNGSADAASSKPDAKQVNASSRSKSAANIESDQTTAKSTFISAKSNPNLTPSESESNETKPAPSTAPASKDQSEDSLKSDNLNASKDRSASMSEVKTNYQQKSKQQQPQQSQQPQQPQQQQVTANGGGGKKSKRPSQNYN